MYIPNPPISLPAGIENTISLDIITLPNFKTSDLPSIEDSNDYPLFSEWIHADENALLNTTGLEGSCDGLPDWRNPVPFDGNGAWDDTMAGVMTEVFAKSTDNESGEEVVFLYDRHFAFLENTVEKPVSESVPGRAESWSVSYRLQLTPLFCCFNPYLSQLNDGGGSIVIDTHDTILRERTKCHNVEPNFSNLDSCILSTSSTACTPQELPMEVIVLNDENLEGIRGMTGKVRRM